MKRLLKAIEKRFAPEPGSREPARATATKIRKEPGARGRTASPGRAHWNLTNDDKSVTQGAWQFSLSHQAAPQDRRVTSDNNGRAHVGEQSASGGQKACILYCTDPFRGFGAADARIANISMPTFVERAPVRHFAGPRPGREIHTKQTPALCIRKP